MVAVDADAMQIQSWEDAASSRADTVLQGKTHDSVRAEIGYAESIAKTLASESCAGLLPIPRRSR